MFFMNVNVVESKCSACAACLAVCPRSCISLLPNEYGMIQASVDEKQCVECNRCIDICPKFNTYEKQKPIKCFASYRKNMYGGVMNCASGGIAYSLYKKFVSEGNYVVGVQLEDNKRAVFHLTDKEDVIPKFQGSKYVQAEFKPKLYGEIERILKEGRKILVIALPCQIAAVKNYISRKGLPSERLFLIDCLCHGVSPQKYLDEELEYLSDKNKWEKINGLTFRSNQKYRDYCLTVFAESAKRKKVYSGASDSDYYFNGFITGISLCESCYDCDYTQVSRISDISIGDFIDIGKNKKFLPYKGRTNNVSIVLCNTLKGAELFSSIKDDLNVFERTVEEAIEQCQALKSACVRHQKRDEFLKNYQDGGFIYAAKETMDEVKKHRIKKKLKQIYKQKYLLNTI